jgi:hypothetical protein
MIGGTWHGRLARELRMSDHSKPDPLATSSQNDDRLSTRKFLIGFTSGVIASFILWVLGRRLFMHPGGGEFFGLYDYSVLLIPLLGSCKIALGIYLLFVPRWKRLGTGLLASAPFGAMILFGVCASN